MKTKLSKHLLLIIILFLTIACSSDDDAKIKTDLTGKTFVLSYADSQEECEQMQEEGTFNCAAYLIFNTRNQLDAIFTDIANDANYSTNNDKVTVNLLEQEVDYDSHLVFKANEDFTELKLTSDGSNSIWKLDREGVDPWDL